MLQVIRRKRRDNEYVFKVENSQDFIRRLKRLRQRSKISFAKSAMDVTIKNLRTGNEDLEC